MKIQAQFVDKTPVEIANTERLTITHSAAGLGEFEIEIIEDGDGFYVRMNGIVKQLAVFPYASNAIQLFARRVNKP